MTPELDHRRRRGSGWPPGAEPGGGGAGWWPASRCSTTRCDGGRRTWHRTRIVGPRSGGGQAVTDLPRPDRRAAATHAQTLGPLVVEHTEDAEGAGEGPVRRGPRPPAADRRGPPPRHEVLNRRGCPPPSARPPAGRPHAGRPHRGRQRHPDGPVPADIAQGTYRPWAASGYHPMG